MYPAYGMALEQLTSLNPARLGEVIPAMYASKDERVSFVASRAIERMPGTEFVGLILTQARDGSKRALRDLLVRKDEKDTARRFKALLEYSQGHPGLWRLLRQNDFYENVAIEEAISLLERPEKQSLEAEYMPLNTRDRERADLRAYLRAAMQFRGDTGPDDLIPERYREWFQEHPPAKKRQ